MILGIDFDNTIIKYDELFYKIAREKNIIPKELKKDKNTVRDYLREQNLENEWTTLQGEVYGNRILEAKPFKGVMHALKTLQEKDNSIFIISHKTRMPFIGPKIDLHEAAYNWLELNHFFSKSGLNLTKDQIFFELTKEMKIDRIIRMGCTHYLDDLTEILEMVPNTIVRILFAPNKMNTTNASWSVVNSWLEITKRYSNQ